MSSDSRPWLTIVTPSLNRARTIEVAIQSVLRQHHWANEHIIVDGCSSDGTADILARYPHLRVIREPDRNLYHAINKGIRAARGEVIALLNTDDTFPELAFQHAERALAGSDYDLVLGGAEFFEQEGTGTPRHVLRGWAANGITEDNAIGNVTTMNAAFYRREIFDRIGVFDERFPLSSDKDFWMRLALVDLRILVIPQILYSYQRHAGSLTFSGQDMRDKLSRHLLALARARYHELPAGTAASHAYRRWHAWAAGYRALQQLRQADMSGAWETATAALTTDPAWLFRFFARMPRHIAAREARRGVVETADCKALTDRE
jgi:glycosyltransferase involved in cell wall biosynthesis